MYARLECVCLLAVIVTASSYNLGSTDVVFHLFTRYNPEISEPLFPDVFSIATARWFSPTSRTVFTIHSHNESVAGNFNAFTVPAHLQSEDLNVIAVDWSAGSSMYSEGLANAPQCGQVIAEFINILDTSFGYTAENIRIVGVGLGGHIAGIAARRVLEDLPHIIALDPSLHGWTHHPERLRKDDADIVEVLHTTAGVIGYDHPLGDIDFYPNGGTFQNGCAVDFNCSHIHSYVYYAESLTAVMNSAAQFVGTACDNYEDAISLQCSGPRDLIFGGPEIKLSGNGIYSFTTNFVQPFARN